MVMETELSINHHKKMIMEHEESMKIKKAKRIEELEKELDTEKNKAPRVLQEPPKPKIISEPAKQVKTTEDVEEHPLARTVPKIQVKPEEIKKVAEPQSSALKFSASDFNKNTHKTTTLKLSQKELKCELNDADMTELSTRLMEVKLLTQLNLDFCCSQISDEGMKILSETRAGMRSPVKVLFR
jgi:hypothetical protein